MVQLHCIKQAGEPGQPAPLRTDRRGFRSSRRCGCRRARGAGLQRQMLLLPGQPAARPQHRGPRWHQCGQELPERRGQRAAVVLRHDQRRRLPRPRGQRLPSGRGERRHHRPMRGARCAVRPRVWRTSGEPLVRRSAGLADVLRARPDRTATLARRVFGIECPDCRRNRENVSAHGDARPRHRRWTRERHRRPRHGHRRDFLLRGGRRHSGHRWLRQRVLSFDQRRWLQCHGDLPRLPARRAFCQPVLHADPPDVHSGERRLPVQAHAHERIAAQRWACLGAEAQGGLRQDPLRHSRGRP